MVSSFSGKRNVPDLGWMIEVLTALHNATIHTPYISRDKVHQNKV